MITLRQAVELTLSAIEEGVSFDHLDNVTAPMLRRALAKADEDRAWVEERKANWAKDKAIAQRNALEEADRIRKAEEEGRCWACGQEIKDE